MKAIDIEKATAPLLEEAIKLEKEAKELRALAKEVEGRLTKIAAPAPAILTNDNPKEVTQEMLLAQMRRKGGRVSHYAARLETTEEKIKQLIQDSQGTIVIGPKGWITMA